MRCHQMQNVQTVLNFLHCRGVSSVSLLVMLLVAYSKYDSKLLVSYSKYLKLQGLHF